ncbi:hypothetical protein AB0G02_24230 [Actinosynnema sp. NPDC023658]|uniref:hypothetical protein n=1 Tax=Actinosynnema sp. NPDC023658 TaxID=3155465 RepID=UPI0033C91371
MCFHGEREAVLLSVVGAVATHAERAVSAWQPQVGGVDGSPIGSVSVLDRRFRPGGVSFDSAGR